MYVSCTLVAEGDCLPAHAADAVQRRGPTGVAEEELRAVAVRARSTLGSVLEADSALGH